MHVFDEREWVDFDAVPPERSTASSPSPAFDVLFGPNNAYPEDSRIWADDGHGTCRVQADANPTRGYQQQLHLSQRLSAAPDRAVRACLVTAGNRVLTLRITALYDNAHSPFRVEIGR